MSEPIYQRAAAFAREPHTTKVSLRRFCELLMEESDRTAAAAGVVLDSVPRERFGDPEAAAIANAVWSVVHSPLTFFAGKPYNVGLAAYRASLRAAGEECHV